MSWTPKKVDNFVPLTNNDSQDVGSRGRLKKVNSHGQTMDERRLKKVDAKGNVAGTSNGGKKVSESLKKLIIHLHTHLV